VDELAEGDGRDEVARHELALQQDLLHRALGEGEAEAHALEPEAELAPRLLPGRLADVLGHPLGALDVARHRRLHRALELLAVERCRRPGDAVHREVAAGLGGESADAFEHGRRRGLERREARPSMPARECCRSASRPPRPPSRRIGCSRAGGAGPQLRRSRASWSARPQRVAAVRSAPR
jgi:hypothetical protein